MVEFFIIMRGDLEEALALLGPIGIADKCSFVSAQPMDRDRIKVTLETEYPNLTRSYLNYALNAHVIPWYSMPLGAN